MYNCRVQSRGNFNCILVNVVFASLQKLRSQESQTTTAE